jgi:hypothetical protein
VESQLDPGTKPPATDGSEKESAGELATSWVPFWFLQFVGVTLCCLIIAADLPGSENWSVPMVFGVHYGHIVLAALVTVYARWNLLLRVTVPPLLISAATLISLAFARFGPGWGEAFLLAGLTIFTWGVAQIPFWVVRNLTAARLQSAETLSATAQAEQFSVRQMLIFTLTVAVIFGAGRALVSQHDVRRFFALDLEDVVTFTLFITALIASGIVIVHVGLQPRPRVSSILGSIGLVAAMTVGLRLAFRELITDGPPNAYSVFSNVVAGQAIWLFLSVMGLRGGGWRLSSAL